MTTRLQQGLRAGAHAVREGARWVLMALVGLYRMVASPVFTAAFGPMGFGCRFHPTCSAYSLEALRRHGAVKGLLLSARRLGRCHPWGGSGFDPVPAHLSGLGSASPARALPSAGPRPSGVRRRRCACS